MVNQMMMKTGSNKHLFLRWKMNKIIVIGVLGLMLVGCVSVCIFQHENYKTQINKDRIDYNNLLSKYIKNKPYSLGDEIIPIKFLIR